MASGHLRPVLGELCAAAHAFNRFLEIRVGDDAGNTERRLALMFGKAGFSCRRNSVRREGALPSSVVPIFSGRNLLQQFATAPDRPAAGHAYGAQTAGGPIGQTQPPAAAFGALVQGAKIVTSNYFTASIRPCRALERQLALRAKVRRVAQRSGREARSHTPDCVRPWLSRCAPSVARAASAHPPVRQSLCPCAAPPQVVRVCLQSVRPVQLAPSTILFVASMNLYRRHLNGSQRAMVAEKLATLKNGQHAVPIAENSQAPHKWGAAMDAAAATMRVGLTTIQDAKKVLAEGLPEEIAAAEAGLAGVIDAGSRDINLGPLTGPKFQIRTSASLQSANARRAANRQCYL
jgi:hypothetical protein